MCLLIFNSSTSVSPCFVGNGNYLNVLNIVILFSLVESRAPLSHRITIETRFSRNGKFVKTYFMKKIVYYKAQHLVIILSKQLLNLYIIESITLLLIIRKGGTLFRCTAKVDALMFLLFMYIVNIWIGLSVRIVFTNEFKHVSIKRSLITDQDGLPCH